MADKKTITRHEPKIMSTPAQSIPAAPSESDGKLGTGAWILIGLGIAAVAALAAGGGGGGGGDSNDGGAPATPAATTGDISFGW